MPALNTRYSSPLVVSLLNLLPTLLLLALVGVGLASLSFSDEHKTVLGAQTSQSQVRTLTVEDRIRELKEATKSQKSEAADKQEKELSR
jgi:hypothetical protein